MPRDIVYFDLETQRTANDAGGWARKGDMRMSRRRDLQHGDRPLRSLRRSAGEPS